MNLVFGLNQWPNNTNSLFKGENRLILAMGGIERHEVLSQDNEDINESIDSTANSNDKYRIFKGNSEHARFLKAYLYSAKKRSPNNRLGISKENPNLKKLAEKEINPKIENKVIKREIQSLFGKTIKYTKEINTDNNFVLDHDILSNPIDSIGTNVYTGFIEQIKGQNITNDNISRLIDNNLNYINDFKESLSEANDNTDKNWINKIKLHLDFLEASYLYLNAERAKLIELEDEEKFNQKTNDIRANIVELNNELLDSDTAKKYEINTNIKGLNKQIWILEKRKNSSAEGILETYKKSIGNSGNDISSAELAMNMYLLVREELLKKKIIIKDAKTEAFIMSACMEKGTKHIIENYKLKEKLEENPEWEMFEKRKGPKTGRLIDRHTFFNSGIKNIRGVNKDKWGKGNEYQKIVAKTEFLNKDGLPKQEHLNDFKKAVWGKRIDIGYNKTKTDINSLVDEFNKFKRKEVLGSKIKNVKSAGEINQLLVNIKNTANTLDNTIDYYKKSMKLNDLDTSKIHNLAEEINKVREIPYVKAWYNKEEKREIKDSENAIEELSYNLTDSIKPIQDTFSNQSVEKSYIYAMLHCSNDKTGARTPEEQKKVDILMKKLENGDTEAAKNIIADINNNFTEKYNEINLKKLADETGLNYENIKDLSKNIEAIGLKGKSERDKIWEVNGIIISGASDSYFTHKKGWWSSEDYNTSALKKDLESGNSKKAIEVLEETLSQDPKNIDFINKLKSGDFESKKAALAIFDEYNDIINSRLEDQKNQIDYVKGIYEKDRTITSRVTDAGSKVFEGMFGDGVPMQKRLMYGALAYVVIFKGLMGKSGMFSKITKMTGGAAVLAMLFEDVTGKPALGFLGIDDPAEVSQGSWLHKEASSSNMESKGEYRSLDILSGKKTEDIIKWWDKRGSEGMNKGNNGEWSYKKALTGAGGLLTNRELNSIPLPMFDQRSNNPEQKAKIFFTVMEKQFERYGKRATNGLETDKKSLIQAGRDEFYKHFTVKGFKEAGINGEIGFLSKSKIEELNGGYKWTWKESTQVFARAEDWAKANKENEILGGWPSSAVNTFNKWKKEGAPKWLMFKSKSEEITDEWIHNFKEHYTPEALEAMEAWKNKGINFTVEKTGDLKVWWKNSPDAITIRRTGGKAWEIVKRGISLPFVATLGIGKYGVDNLNDGLQNIESKIDKWENSNKTTENALFVDLLMANPTPVEYEARLEKLSKIISTKGYDLFGKYENDWWKIEEMQSDNLKLKKVSGLLSRKDLISSPTSRVDFKNREGYVNVIGLDFKHNIPGSKNRAYKDAIDNFMEQMNTQTNLEHLDPTDDFTKAITSGNIEKIYPFVEEYGGIKSKNGYTIFLRIPVPLNNILISNSNNKYTNNKSVYNFDTNASTSVSEERKIKKQNEYFLRKNGEWKHGTLDKYKKTLIISSSDKFEKEYNLGDGDMNELKDELYLFNNHQVNETMEKGVGLIDGIEIEDYGSYDNKNVLFINAIINNKEVIMREKHWAAKEGLMKNILVSFNKNWATDFRNYHKNIKEVSKKLSYAKGIKEYFSPGKLELEYRFYIAEKITKAYRANQEPKDPALLKSIFGQAGVQESQWVKRLSEKYILEEIVKPYESIPIGILEKIGELFDVSGSYLYKNAIKKAQNNTPS